MTPTRRAGVAPPARLQGTTGRWGGVAPPITSSSPRHRLYRGLSSRSSGSCPTATSSAAGARSHWPRNCPRQPARAVDVGPSGPMCSCRVAISAVRARAPADDVVAHVQDARRSRLDREQRVERRDRRTRPPGGIVSRRAMWFRAPGTDPTGTLVQRMQSRGRIAIRPESPSSPSGIMSINPEVLLDTAGLPLGELGQRHNRHFRAVGWSRCSEGAVGLRPPPAPLRSAISIGPSSTLGEPPVQILLTNDDGVFAPGLRALRKELLRLGDVTVIAPALEQSGVAHSITLLDAPGRQAGRRRGRLDPGLDGRGEPGRQRQARRSAS